MPIYEYKCAKCNSVFEALVKSASEKPDACPKCGGKKLEKQLSAFSASVSSGSDALPCSSGACSPGACSTGSCPWAG